MINSIDLNIRLSLFALSGYKISLLDKYDLEPDIKIVSKQGIQRAFCTFCGNEVKHFYPDLDSDLIKEGFENHDHFCESFQIHLEENLV